MTCIKKKELRIKLVFDGDFYPPLQKIYSLSEALLSSKTISCFDKAFLIKNGYTYLKTKGRKINRTNSKTPSPSI
jgi:hypothetical protein